MDDMLTQVEPMIPALRRYARSLCGDVETADDVVQDCLEKAVADWNLDDPIEVWLGYGAGTRHWPRRVAG